MKVVSVVGARPQFIKAAVVGHALRKNHTEILVHTGQHYDYNMSEKFFEELEIPMPDYNLGISGGTHAEMTGRMLIEIERVLISEKPDAVLVYGDTNSTLSAALAAAKLYIPIVHVEAGVRTYCRTNPEEINRVCTDHVSSLLLCCTQSGMDNISLENLHAKALLVGDPMYDAFLKYRCKSDENGIALISLAGERVNLPLRYYYLTCHREENTSGDNNLLEILTAMNSLEEACTVYPVHPRNKMRVLRLNEQYHFKNILFVQPVGYLESIYLVCHAEKIVTDSGGLQREAFFAHKKCITIFDSVSWPETIVAGRNEICKPLREDILKAISHEQFIDKEYEPFGDGHSAEKIIKAMELMLCRQ